MPISVGREAGSIYAKVDADLGGFNRGMASVDRQLHSTRGKVAQGFGAMNKAAKVGMLGIAGAVAFAVNSAGNFEQSLNTLQAVTHATGAEMKRASKLAQALGKDVTLPATSAKDAADAMTELAKGGLKVNQVFKAAKGVLQLSAAAQISNAEAATITARALNSFGLSGSKATHVADVLANAANISTGEITDMAMALAQSSAIAKSAGLSIEDTAAAISLLANKGVIGSDAGTSLKTMLMRLVPETNKAKDAMKALGVSTFDSSGNYRSFRDIVSQYHDALVKLTPAQRAHAIQTIFGQDAARAANIIFGDSVKVFDQMKEGVSKQGAAAELAAAKMKGFKGSLEAAKSNAETLAISLGLVLLPAATALMGGLSGVVDVMGEHQTLALAVVATLGVLATAVVTVNTAMKVYKATAAAVTVVQSLFGASATVAAGQVNLLTASIARLAAPLAVALAGYRALKELTGSEGRDKSKIYDFRVGDYVPVSSLTHAGGPRSGRAHGGPVSAGFSYTVGERGPEVFTPNVSGRIIPNGGQTINLNVNMPNYLGNRREAARELLEELASMSRGGGALFSRTVGVTT